LLALNTTQDIESVLYTLKLKSIKDDNPYFILSYISIVILVDYIPMMTFQISLIISYYNNSKANQREGYIVHVLSQRLT
jgi:hypothetical protein